MYPSVSNSDSPDGDIGGRGTRRTAALMTARRSNRVGLLAIVILCTAALTARAAELWQTLPPTPALPKGTVGEHADINGARIWYAQWNRQSTRTPVLLLHGGFGNSSYFGRLIPDLAAHGYYVIAMDSRGHGRSARSAAPLSYRLMADDVIALLDRLKIPKVNLVGWSDGGIIGLELALNHPDRLAGLFAFGANADVSGLNDGVEKTPVFSAYLKRTADEYRELSPTPDQWAAFSAAINKMWDTLPAFSADQLRAIRVRTTIADGEYDEAIKQTHDQYMAATIPGARLVILPNLSHFAMLQNPRQFNAAVLAFLQER
jgi:pimeloyl-ACP methyl ester carboxylesterase